MSLFSVEIFMRLVVCCSKSCFTREFIESGLTEILCKFVLFRGLLGFVDIPWNFVKFCHFSKSDSRGKLYSLGYISLWVHITGYISHATYHMSHTVWFENDMMEKS